ncbi:MAG: cell division protein FtsZ [Proteobacteria bacterium]|nr:cell division protein FtsZ [Pseudomonadota bacterium]
MVIDVDNIESQPITIGLPSIKVVGIGGSGGNVVNRMIQENVKGVQYVAMNTDTTALNSSLADIAIPIGTSITRGLGAGMKPEVGRASAIEEMSSIKTLLEDSDLVFLAAGMGGGTGTGAIPVVAEIAKEMKILTVAVVTTPFSFEGAKRAKLAEDGINELKKHIDTLVVIPNTKLLELASPKTTMTEAFLMADDVLKQAISGITNLINLEGMINLDFADLHTVMSNKGAAFMGTGIGKGDNRGLAAVKKAISSPLITQPIDGATGVIINIVADDKFPLFDAEAAAEFIQESANQDADVIFGLVYDPKLKNEVSVTVIATGYDPHFWPEPSETIQRVPLRVADSIKTNSKPPAKTTQRISSPPKRKEPQEAEEIEVPHFMRRR